MSLNKNAIREMAASASQPSTELNIRYILFSLGGIALGVALNWMVRKKQEADIINTLTAEIDKLNSANAQGKLNSDQQHKLVSLTAQKTLMTKINNGKKITPSTLSSSPTMASTSNNRVAR
jgi:hypothetical protein